LILECDNLTLGVPGRVLCRGLGLRVAAGERWGVLGGNGSGKTTLLHTLSGLAQPAQGRVRLQGRALDEWRSEERARVLGIVLQQEEAGFWGTAFEYAVLGRFPRAASWLGWQLDDRVAAQAALSEVDMLEYADRAFSTLSGGERQRVRVAQVLAQAPALYLLDEPLQHLDLRHQALLLALFRRRAQEHGEAVVMVLHDTLWAAQWCSHVLLLYGDGAADAGPAHEMLVRDRLERAYGCRLRRLDAATQHCYVPDV